MKQLNIWNYLQRLLLTILVISLFGVFFLLAWATVDALILLFIGMLLAVILRTLANPIARHTPLNDKFSLITVILLLILVILLGGWLFIPEIIEQAEAFIIQANQAILQLEQFLLQYSWGRDLLEGFVLQDPSDLPFQALLPRITETFGLTLTGLRNIFFIFFIGLFLAWSPGLYRSGFINLIPPRGRKRTNEVMDAMVDGLRSWLLGQLISMCLIGVLTGVGLALFGVPLAFFLGIISGVLEFVPILGSIISPIPGILIASTLGFSKMIYVTLFYIAIQQIEGNLLTPIVQRQTVSLPPALTLTAIFVMGLLFGVLAVFIATPLAAVILILVKMVYLEDILGSR